MFKKTADLAEVGTPKREILQISVFRSFRTFFTPFQAQLLTLVKAYQKRCLHPSLNTKTAQFFHILRSLSGQPPCMIVHTHIHRSMSELPHGHTKEFQVPSRKLVFLFLTSLRGGLELGAKTKTRWDPSEFCTVY